MENAKKLKNQVPHLSLVKNQPGIQIGKRSLELDVLRGFAIILMIFFHTTHDLRVFGSKALVASFPDWYWNWFPEFIGILFFSIVGISARVKYESMATPKFKFFANQAAKVGLSALIITAATSYYTPKQMITFGTLHCIAVGSALVYPFLKMNRLNLFFGLLIAGVGFFLEQQRFTFGNFFWLGFAKVGQTGGDWYPLMPWFGVILIGTVVGRMWIERFLKSESEFSSRLRATAISWPLAWLGRHSLIIYLLHQPILIALLSLTGLISLNRLS